MRKQQIRNCSIALALVFGLTLMGELQAAYKSKRLAAGQSVTITCQAPIGSNSGGCLVISPGGECE